VDQILLIAPIGAAVASAFFYLRRFATPSARYWSWAWLLLYGSGLLSAFERESLWLAALGDGGSAAFGPLLLAGALALVGREVPRWLWPLAALAVAARVLASLGLGFDVPVAVVLVVEWPWLVGATWVVGRDALTPSGRGPERILAIAVAGLALLWPVDAVLRANQLSVLPILGAWISLSVLVVVAQIFVAFERVARVEQALRAERERLARLVEETSDLIGIADSGGRLEYLNAAGRRMLSLAEIEDVSVFTLHPREEAERLAKEIFPVARERGLWQGETVLRARTGQLVPVSAVLFPQVGAAGEVASYSTSMRDLSERVAREQALESERSLIRTIVEAIPVGIFHLDRDGRYRLINRAAAAMFQLPDPDAWIGRPAIECLREVVAPRIRDLDELTRSFTAWLRGAEPVAPGNGASALREASMWRVIENRTLEIHRIELVLDNPVQILEVALAPVPGADRDDRGHSSVWTVRDVTEQRQLEERLQRRTRAEAVGQFAGSIAHDFGNLLMVIGGFSELLHNRVANDEEAGACIASIESAVGSGQALIGQILAFSRGTRGVPTLVDLNQFLTDARGLLERLIGERIRLDLLLPPGVVFVRADPSQLEQLMMNLASNARDAMPEGGILRIEASWLSSDDSPEPQRRAGWTRIAVSDTGCGMSPGTHARAFEPFFTTKPHGEGTGLGLSTVSAIVHQLGGEIRIHSTLGEGTLFEIDLPCVEELSTASATTHRVDPAGALDEPAALSGTN